MHESKKVQVKSLSRVPLLATPWTAAYQAPPSMGFSRQEYWSGVPLPSPTSTWANKNERKVTLTSSGYIVLLPLFEVELKLRANFIIIFFSVECYFFICHKNILILLNIMYAICEMLRLKTKPQAEWSKIYN